MKYLVLGKPSQSEFPAVPSKKEVTVLKGEAADEFYRKKAEIEGR